MCWVIAACVLSGHKISRKFYFPGTYEPSLICHWLIQGNQDQVVALNFTRLDIEGPHENDTKKCPYDYVQVYIDHRMQKNVA